VEDFKAYQFRGAVAVAIGVASVVQPELIVGSVAMIGKMAADRAKTTANEIAVEASTHVVNELSKDLNEELAEHGKLEATTTKTDTVKTEKNIDEAAGTITKKEAKQSVKETTIQVSGGTVSATSAEDGLDTSKDTKAGEKVAEGEEEKASTVDVVKDDDSDTLSTDAVKKEVAAEPEKTTVGDGKHSSVVVKSTTKTTSIRIDEDGTITIGTDTPTEIEPARVDETATKAADKPEISGVQGALTESSPESVTEVSKSLENKINEVIEEVAGKVPVETTGDGIKNNNQDSVVGEKPLAEITLPKDSDTTQAVPPEPLIVSPVKSTPPVMHSTAINSETDGKGFSTLEESLVKIHKKLDALGMTNVRPAKEVREQGPPTIDTHTHESLAQIHQKLDDMIALRGKESEVTTPVAELKEPTTILVEDANNHVLRTTVEKIHISTHFHLPITTGTS
jgi:hypothetical protein